MRAIREGKISNRRLRTAAHANRAHLSKSLQKPKDSALPGLFRSHDDNEALLTNTLAGRNARTPMLDAPQHVQVSSKTFYRLKSIGKMYETLQKEYQNLQNENQTLLEENQSKTTENLSSQSTVAFQSPTDEAEKMSFAEEIEDL